jgi:hypothetical protein
MRRWILVGALALSLAGLMARMIVGRALALDDSKAPPGPPAKDKPLKLPQWWKPEDPLPLEKTNCVRCHLTAGRELTVPLRDFARSVHDRVKMSCNDCHGGNTKDDSTAHEAEHHFIGTKMSAHITNCSTCHSREAEDLGKSKHYWDLAKGINRKLPVCIDCHGNHDIGKPPADFSLTNVCTDCHKQFAKDYSHAAAVVAENDKLWEVLRKVQAQNLKMDNPVPAPFQRDLARVRSKTANLMHRAVPVNAEQAQSLNDRVRKLRIGLETWLQEHK